MNGSTFSLTMLALLALTMAAEARGQAQGEPAVPVVGAAPVQLAQSREDIFTGQDISHGGLL